jgi:hypothetical protein
LYFRDLIGETYLVAAKTADKIRFLEAAQNLFAWALRYLLVWLALFVVVSIWVAPTVPGPKPTQVEILKSPARHSETVVRLDQSRPPDVSATVRRSGVPAAALVTPRKATQ